jgi:DNA primase
MTDTQGIKQGIDLLALIEQSTGLRRHASTKGGEWVGPCPFCGGNDRFHVWPLSESPGWWCRFCQKSGDAIAFVMERDSVSFADACRQLEGWNAPVAPEPPAPTTNLPSWQATGADFIAHCEAALWSADGFEGLAYLRQRGLEDETIHRYQLGWNGDTLYRPRERWGLTGKSPRIWLPRGIVIPWIASGELQAIKIRRPDADTRDTDEGKYVAVAGSRPVLFGSDTIAAHDVTVLVESELDAMLVEQTAGDLAGAVATGSAKASLDTQAITCLLPASRVLVAYDSDPAGEKAAAGVLTLSSRMRRVKIPIGKDPTEFHQQGGRIRDWVALNVMKHAPTIATPPEPIPDDPMIAIAETRGWPKVGVCLMCDGVAMKDLLWYCLACGNKLYAEGQAKRAAEALAS